MDAGKAVTVNLDQYLKTLSWAGFQKDTEKLKGALVKYGIKGDTTFYQGPKAGDGEILLTYKMGNITGILKFTQAGKLDDAVMEKTRVLLSTESAGLFIAGLFGKGELSKAFDRNTDLLFQGIVQAHACYDNTSTTQCDYQGVVLGLAKVKLQKLADEYNWYATRVDSRETLLSRTSMHDGQIIQFPANISEIKKNIGLYNAKLLIAQEVYMREKTVLLKRKVEKLYKEIKEEQPWYKSMFTEAAKQLMENWEEAKGTTIRSKFCAAVNTYDAMSKIADDLRDYNLDGTGTDCHTTDSMCDKGSRECKVTRCKSSYHSNVTEESVKKHYLDKSWLPTEVCNLKAEILKE